METGSMLKNGTYAAWFRTSLADGTGIVHVADGRLWGSDAVMLYSGTYEVDGECFSAVLTTQRHSRDGTTVFGTDDLVVRLEGIWTGAIATCTGRADAVPDLAFEVTLIPRARRWHPSRRRTCRCRSSTRANSRSCRSAPAAKA
ncbi:hypothetical protein J2R76_000708 [Bradyrhizobium sp. USDA 4532]|uniref:hypothetical protein n=1 Tax=Bradyrhizobium sp. USDA 4532 TaxID=2817700 RepID=UPI0020A21C42|nr:hypothetical protein [Bradyrhizobium sp. USDA 4532]MCP1917117.1 hypothetical protein [Bradyrhizobium sp. USDA 4532]